MSIQELMEDAGNYLMHTYARFPVAFVKGNGCYLYDTEGKQYLDFGCGIGVTGLGHNHPKVTEVIQAQAAQLLHCSNLFQIPSQIALARRLVEHSDFDRVFFCNSGAEANEGAIKLARRYSQLTYGSHKHKIITFHHAFHGRTITTLAATPTEKYQEGYTPLTPGFSYAIPEDLESVRSLYTEETCAVLLEPVQGEGGVIPFSKEFLRELRAWCDENGVLLIFDEVQTGCGRTGSLFAYQQFGVVPDIMTLAKGLGNGVPIGAILAKETVASAFTPGTHGTTFGGNPLATTAALATLEVLAEQSFLAHVQGMAKQLVSALQDLQQAYPELIVEIRGLGLMQGIVLHQPVASEIVKGCLERGLVVLVAGASTVRLLPPLILEPSHIDQAMETLHAVFQTQLKDLATQA
jgi:acetylornithine/N-succinyldiaminopimelate aminotransferase